MGSALPRVMRDSPDLAWRSLAGEEDIGGVRALLRPDERCFLLFDSCRGGAYGPLLAAAAEELGRDLYLTVDEADDRRRRRLEQLGFTINRRESHYLIPLAPESTGLGGAEDPPGFLFVRADEVDQDRLRVLDDALRQDVPGTDGWRWDEAGFREETSDSSFDPATYVIAVEEGSGEYAGLVRVWNNPNGSRLGMIGVLRPFRRLGLARALLARAFRVLDERGKTAVSTEVDDTDVASTSLLTGLGARRTGGSIELIRRHRRG